MKTLKPRGDVKKKIENYLEHREDRQIRDLLDKAEKPAKS